VRLTGIIRAFGPLDRATGSERLDAAFSELVKERYVGERAAYLATVNPNIGTRNRRPVPSHVGESTSPRTDPVIRNRPVRGRWVSMSGAGAYPSTEEAVAISGESR
jgi:hypothetical protein